MSLDAVRGIAACAVVLSHCYLVLPEAVRTGFEATYWSWLLQPFVNGKAAVTIFFALSGYVLSLPYIRGRQLPYVRYVIRRVCRIYVPFAVSILFSLALYAAAGHPTSPWASQWFNELWPDTWPGAATIGGHFLMIGTNQDMALNPPMWTLVYEMRVSLLFPLLVVLCRYTAAASVLSLIVLVGSIKLLVWMGQNAHPSFATTVAATFVWLAHMVPYFVIGILLCRHRPTVRGWFHRIPPLARPVLFVATVAVFCIPAGFGSAKDNILYAIASGLVIVFGIESRVLRVFLERPGPQFLGRISYSLYLIHLPIMIVVVPFLLDQVSFMAMVAIVMAVSIGAATVMHAVFEIPAMKLGRSLTAVPARRRALSNI